MNNECVAGVETDGFWGRHRTTMPFSEVDAYLAGLSEDEGLSDLWCITHDDQNCPE